jgi:hypothetical protein
VAQEAKRLADLGLSPTEIATKLEVERSTVQRWMAAGKLTDTRRSARGQGKVPVSSPGGWAASVRASYALDATDEELVNLGEAALRKVHSPKESPQVQLNAMGRFIAIVKQLALVARNADAVPEPAPEQKKTPAAPPRRRVVDPRTFLQAVK